jgi:hypothetical protein
MMDQFNSEFPTTVNPEAATFTGRALLNSRAPVAVRVERLLRIREGKAPLDLTTLADTQLADLGGVPVSAIRKGKKNGNGHDKKNGALKLSAAEAQHIEKLRALPAEEQLAFWALLDGETKDETKPPAEMNAPEKIHVIDLMTALRRSVEESSAV